MKEYNDKGIKFNYKEGLNEGDFVALVEYYINAYNNGIFVWIIYLILTCWYN